MKEHRYYEYWENAPSTLVPAKKDILKDEGFDEGRSGTSDD